ncbi:MAG TPA: hypothetical protein DEB39_12995 [Planctomycetaceae bacterium]|nr:hypothetical protein [Planctomycetaceae bacterium]
MPATRVHSLSRTDAEPTGAPGDTRYFHTDLVIPFLYDLPADGESVRRLKAIEGELVLRTDLPARAAYWILRQLGVSAAVTLEPHSASPESPEHQERQEHPMSSVPDTVSPVFVKEPVRHRWYPVVDQDACTGCLECVNFCMFGVYVIDRRDKPLVEQPDACRDGCPACSRVCPGGAIMFPLYDDPVISGRQRRGIDKNVLSPRATKSSPPSVETAPSEHLLDALLDEVDGMEL